jgi:hypothetical protein
MMKATTWGPRAGAMMLAGALALAAGCSAPQHRAKAQAAKPISADAGRAMSLYDREVQYVTGVVTGYPTVLYYTGELEINGHMYTLAGVGAVFNPSGPNPEDHICLAQDEDKVTLEAIRRLAPIGTPVAAVFSSRARDAVFVHANPPNSGPSINEQLVRAGLAADNGSEATDMHVRPDAAVYYTAVGEARVKAEEVKAGVWGMCEKARVEWEREQAKALAEMERAERGGGGAGTGGDYDVDWGDGYCDTCNAIRGLWNFFR